MSHLYRPLACALCLAALWGCNPREAAPVVDRTDKAHGHKPGKHGGKIVHIGRDRYHAEPVFEKDGVVRLYMLDQDETKVLAVEARPTQGHVRIHGDVKADPVEVTFEPEPLDGDGKGKTSRFRARLPESLRDKRVDVTIPAMMIDGNRYRVAFTSPDPHTMPAQRSSAEERETFLKPGGLYTAADIEKNGKQTASEKWPAAKAWKHDSPKPGDRICPVTSSKANPDCSWIVGGKTYMFCCPPCVSQFVEQAKTDPDSIQPPEAYRKK